MAKNFKQQLIEDHPVFFSRVQAIELDEPGWQGLIGKLIKDLASRAPEHTPFTCSHIKEKNGRLRVYLNEFEAREHLNTLAAYEVESMSVCYRCGSQGTYHSASEAGWAHVYCDCCEADYQKNGRQ